MLRLDRMLVTLGKGSRSEMQKAIRGGRVRVNGDVQRDPSVQVGEDAEILLNGEKLDTRLTRHVMLHKPAGLLTAARDKKQPTVMDLLPAEYAAIGCMPVGRLDKDTTGLLLLTTDGELNHRLLAPARHVDKTYLATLDKPADLTPLPDNQARVTIHEGKFHQVKRMFAAVEREVLTLHRETFGSLVLDEALPCGQWRELTEAEASALYRDAQMEEKHG